MAGVSGLFALLIGATLWAAVRFVIGIQHLRKIILAYVGIGGLGFAVGGLLNTFAPTASGVILRSTLTLLDLPVSLVLSLYLPGAILWTALCSSIGLPKGGLSGFFGMVGASVTVGFALRHAMTRLARSRTIHSRVWIIAYLVTVGLCFIIWRISPKVAGPVFFL